MEQGEYSLGKSVKLSVTAADESVVPRIKILFPPSRKGMKVLDKSAFSKEISVTSILVLDMDLKNIVRSLKPYLLRVQRIKAIQDIPEVDNKKRVYLNPELVPVMSEVKKQIPELENYPDILNSTSYESLTLTYDNWKWNELLDAILPDDQDKFGGFTIVGRLVHVNLKDHLLPYKNMIGEILLDKVPNVKTVVNKLTSIDNTFRNFQMEVLAGCTNTVVKVKENYVEFEFDFATVYWNSRLSSEHERIVEGYLKSGDTLFDVFAGVGPFSIPAAKKKCHVFANDLNPESYKWLCHNATKNKVSALVTTFNKDGKEFILQDLSAALSAAANSKTKEGTLHIAMNLPAIAVEFLRYFWGLLYTHEDGSEPSSLHPDFNITVHVYCFIKALEGHKEKALQLVKDQLNYDLPRDKILEVFFVRNVAPNKDMYRVSFNMPHDVLESPAPDFSEVRRVEDPPNYRKRKFSSSEIGD